MVAFSNFRILDPEAADIARELVTSDDGRSAPFLPFINVWMGFNGWMESITDAGSDAAMITAVADHRRVTSTYAQLLERNPPFRQCVFAFAELWPVLNVRDVKSKLGRDAFQKMDRDSLMEACREAKVKSQPQGWIPGESPTWSEVLRTIYLIRCNLFHGAKSPQNIRDRHLVQRANGVLRGFIDGSCCLDWYD